MKSNDGQFNLFGSNQEKFPLKEKIDPHDFNKNFRIVQKDLEDMGYIKHAHSSFSYVYQLTEKGWEFESFKDKADKANEIKNLESLAIEKLVLDVNKLRSDMKDAGNIKRNAKISNYSAVVSALGALLTAILMLIQWKCKDSGG